jgi:hypothetical protein
MRKASVIPVTAWMPRSPVPCLAESPSPNASCRVIGDWRAAGPHAGGEP